jgi:hypothetical protein
MPTIRHQTFRYLTSVIRYLIFAGWSSRSPQSAENQQHRARQPPKTRTNPDNAGWSSPVARQAHNLKVIGSNPIPATTFTERRYASGTAGSFEPAFLLVPRLIIAAISPISSISRPPSAACRTMRSIRPRRISSASVRVSGSGSAERPSGDRVQPGWGAGEARGTCRCR